MADKSSNKKPVSSSSFFMATAALGVVLVASYITLRIFSEDKGSSLTTPVDLTEKTPTETVTLKAPTDSGDIFSSSALPSASQEDEAFEAAHEKYEVTTSDNGLPTRYAADGIIYSDVMRELTELGAQNPMPYVAADPQANDKGGWDAFIYTTFGDTVFYCRTDDAGHIETGLYGTKSLVGFPGIEYPDDMKLMPDDTALRALEEGLKEQGVETITKIIANDGSTITTEDKSGRLYTATVTGAEE